MSVILSIPGMTADPPPTNQSNRLLPRW